MESRLPPNGQRLKGEGGHDPLLGLNLLSMSFRSPLIVSLSSYYLSLYLSRISLFLLIISPATEDGFNVETEIYGKNTLSFCVSSTDTHNETQTSDYNRCARDVTQHIDG